MIERASEFGASAAAPLVAGDSTLMTAGDMLRVAREAHGLDISVVAAALKVPTAKLEALEADNIDALPDPVFARALAASVCRALKVDPAPVLAKLPGPKRPGLADADRTISTNLRAGAPHQGRGNGLSAPSRALLAVVALLLVGAAALFWLPQSAFDQVGSTVSHWVARDESAPASAEPINAPAPASTVVESVTPAAPAVEPVAPPVAAVAASAPKAPAPGADAVSFTARAEAWITVTEAGGKVLLKRTVKEGETVGLSGALPLSVVVGRAAGVDVLVRGQPFDLKPLTKAGGVARFEVKQ